MQKICLSVLEIILGNDEIRFFHAGTVTDTDVNGDEIARGVRDRIERNDNVLLPDLDLDIANLRQGIAHQGRIIELVIDIAADTVKLPFLIHRNQVIVSGSDRSDPVPGADFVFQNIVIDNDLDVAADRQSGNKIISAGNCSKCPSTGGLYRNPYGGHSSRLCRYPLNIQDCLPKPGHRADFSVCAAVRSRRNLRL